MSIYFAPNEWYCVYYTSNIFKQGRSTLEIFFDKYLKELRHDIFRHFFDGLSRGLSVEKSNSNEGKNQRGDSKAKRNEDG